MIDNTEEKILYLLLNEARTSLTQIAKECKISVPSVDSRIKTLKKKEIINGAIMQINPLKLGFSCCGVLQISASPKKENRIRKYLASKKFIFYDNKLLSRGLFGVFFALPNINGLARMIEHLKNHEDIKEVNPLIWNDVENIDFPKNLNLSSSKKLLLNNKENSDTNTLKLEEKSLKEYQILKENKGYIFDKKDVEIAKILAEKARTPFSNIAKQLKISTNNVISRYKRLRKEKILSNSTITINLKKLDYKAMAVLFLKSSPASNASKLYHQIIQKTNVIVAIRLIGPLDVMINVPVRSFSEIFELQEKIYQIRGIENVITELHGPFEKWPLNIFAPLLERIK